MKTTIRFLDQGATREEAGSLGELLVDSVAGGASVGFGPGLEVTVAATWWRDSVAPRVGSGSVILLVAEIENAIVGTVQLAFPSYPNGRRRAEIAKLLVHSAWRRKGVAEALMRAAEEAALAGGRVLLILDTETGSDAEKLYAKWGWVVAGVVPDYFIGSDGSLHPTTFMYRRLA